MNTEKEQHELTAENAITGAQVNGINLPQEYVFCFQHDCPEAATCMLHFAGQHLDERPLATVVLPGARKDGKCKWHRTLRTMRGAWGFKQLFDDVKAKDASTLREAIKTYLGGNGTYYQYHHGQRLLTPEQQAWIVSLFKDHGYREHLLFDGYRDDYDW